jgi:hypothetical protein
MQLPEAMIGQKGECPNCSEVVVPVPVLGSLSQEQALPPKSAADLPAEPEPPPAATDDGGSSDDREGKEVDSEKTPRAEGAAINDTIEFTCPHCSHKTKLAPSTEGMKGNCPSCNSVVTISADSPRNPSALPQQPPQPSHASPIIQYYIQRGSTVTGPLSLTEVQKRAKQKEFLVTDLFSETPEGPFNLVGVKLPEWSAEEKQRKDEQDGEPIQNSNFSKVIGGLSVVAFFLVVGYFIRDWVISVDGERDVDFLSSLSNSFDGALSVWPVVLFLAVLFVLCCFFHHIYETK